MVDECEECSKLEIEFGEDSPICEKCAKLVSDWSVEKDIARVKYIEELTCEQCIELNRGGKWDIICDDCISEILGRPIQEIYDIINSELDKE